MFQSDRIEEKRFVFKDQIHTLTHGIYLIE